MGRTVTELKHSMTEREFRGYQAYWEKEPFGDEGRQIAQVAFLIYAANGGNRTKRLNVEDFMPRIVKQQTGDDVAASLLAWAESMQSKAKGDSQAV